MSLYDFVYNLQRKPYRTRKKILAGLLIFSFVVLAAFWVFMFKRQVAEGLGESEPTAAGKFLGEDKALLSPAAALADGFKGLVGEISRKIRDYKNSPARENDRPVYELPVEVE